MVEPYLPFILQTLEKFPTLTASRLHAMVRERGYQGTQSQFRHQIALHRPRPAAEAFLRLRTLPGEQGQVDWGHFGHLQIGRARRPLMAFVMVLSYSRAIYLRFLLDARMENFLRGHVGAFETWEALPRVLLYDNLKSAVLERQGDAIRFHPTLLAFAAHYRFEPRPVAVARGNEKGRVERAIRYVREAFFAARTFRDLDNLNAQAAHWCAGQAADRPCPEDGTMSVRAALAGELLRLLQPVRDRGGARREGRQDTHVRFDLNDYSIPHTHVRRMLIVRASPVLVRVFDGATVIASHARSYDAKAQIEQAEHVEALVAHKRHARQHRGVNSLTRAAPSCRELLVLAAERGDNIGSLAAALLRLLDRYGAAPRAAARRRWPWCCRSTSGARTRRCARTASSATTDSVRRRTTMSQHNLEQWRARAQALRLNGLLEHWVAPRIQWEEDERARRSLQRRPREARLGKFRALADFDWNRPKRIERAAVEELMSLAFMADASNVVFVGSNGVGKSTLAMNVAHQALVQGHTVLFASAGQMLGELAALDSDSTLRRRLRRYVQPAVLVIDEVGYLSYSNRHADLLFELISRRYQKHSTIDTANRPFAEWSEVFPNAACVVSLVDRLVHRAEVIAVDGESYRLKEARERNEARAQQRDAKKVAHKGAGA